MRVRIKELLDEKSKKEGRLITQKVMSAETGLDQTTISRYARGWSNSISVRLLEVMQDYFGATFDEILERNRIVKD